MFDKVKERIQSVKYQRRNKRLRTDREKRLFEYNQTVLANCAEYLNEISNVLLNGYCTDYVLSQVLIKNLADNLTNALSGVKLISTQDSVEVIKGGK